jgi:hypothetical protein
VLARDRALGAVCRDAGRYVGATAALHLHLASALTLPRLRDACVASGFMSPGRARGVLRLLQDLGYVAAAPPASAATGSVATGCRARRFVARSGFLSAWRDQLRAALEAAELLEPAVAVVRERLDEPAVAATCIRLHGEALLDAAPGDEGAPVFRILLHRDGGSLLTSLLVAHGREDDPFPTPGPVRLSLAGIARRFSVSRAQFRRLLQDAASAGLLTPAGPAGEQRMVAFTPATHEFLRFLYAAQLAELLATAAGTVRALSGNPAPRARLGDRPASRGAGASAESGPVVASARRANLSS